MQDQIGKLACDTDVRQQVQLFYLFRFKDNVMGFMSSQQSMQQ